MIKVMPITACLFQSSLLYLWFYLMAFSEGKHCSFIFIVSESVIMYYKHFGKMNNQLDYSTDFLIYM